MSLRKVSFFQNDSEAEVVLPIELVTSILSQLTIEELANVRLVSEAFGDISRHDVVWRTLFRKYFHVNVLGTNIMEKFIFHFTLEKEIENYLNSKYMANHDNPANCTNYLLNKTFNYLDDKEKVEDVIWIYYLYGKINILLANLSVGDAIKADYQKKGLFCLLKSAKLGNPKAMYLLARPDLDIQNLSNEEKMLWLTKSHELGYPEATFQFCAMSLKNYIQSGFKDMECLKNYYEYLIQAANKGSPDAALQLAKAYEASITALSVANYMSAIPFGDHEWAYLNWQGAMQKERMKHDGKGSGDYDFFIYQSTLEFAKYVFPAAFLAVEMLSLPQYVLSDSNGKSIKESRSAELLVNGKNFLQSSIEGRKGRMKFWYEKAAKAGLSEAIEKLDKLNDASKAGCQLSLA